MAASGSGRFAMTLHLRELTPEEQSQLEKLAYSRTAPAQTVERARILWQARQGDTAPSIAAELRLDGDTVRRRINRFNAEGLGALEDHPRSGRPATYSPEQVATVIAAALSQPETLGLPFACGTLDRLTAYLNEHEGIAIKRSRIDEILIREGLRWRQQETWFGERLDPAFAEKRGSLRRSTPHLPRAAL
jgi:transposase